MKRVLVTGASGFIGSNTLKPLLQRGFEVHAVSRKMKAGHEGFFWHSSYLLEPGEQKRLLAHVKPTHLLHMAWHVEHGKYVEASENKDWLEASTSLFKLFAKSGGRRIVVAGTCLEYDWSAKSGNIHCDEATSRILPHTLYGKTKNELHQRLQKIALPDGYAWGRLFYLYGPGEPSSRLVPNLIRALETGFPLPVWTPEWVRDYLYVKDVGDAFSAVVASNFKGALNIASGKAIQLDELANVLARLLNSNAEIKGESPMSLTSQGPPTTITANTDRLNKEVGWTPTYTLETGLSEMLGIKI